MACFALALLLAAWFLPAQAYAGQTEVAAVEGLLRSGVQSHQTSIDVSSANASTDDAKTACESIIYDPQIYTLFSRYSINSSGSTAQTITLTYAVSTSELTSWEAKVEAKVTEALSWIDGSMTNAQKAQALHDYLVRNCAYDQTAADNPPQDGATSAQMLPYTALGALVQGKAVCQGYSDAYSLLLSRAGISSEYVISTSMNHGWCLVNIDGAWYHVDVTRDDLLINGKDQGAGVSVSHESFLKSDSTFRSLGYHDWKASHTASSDYSMVYETYKGPRTSIQGATISLDKTSYTATGSAIEPTVKSVSLNGTYLVVHTDYEVSYSNNVNPGTATVTVRGRGSYTGTAQTTFTIVGAQSMHRLYNPNSGEHFYTASTVERDHLVSVGWNYEGVGWSAPLTGAEVYRLYNPNAGDHHYTLSSVERDYLVSVGWNYEGVGWHSGGSVPLYRQYNPNAEAGAHNFTTSKAENDWLVSLGWNAEGIGWYGVS